MKFYEGKQGANEYKVTTANGDKLNPRLDLRQHSTTGFAWGHGGFGADQLALAILADCLNDAEALRYYQRFKWEMIANINTDTWKLTEEQILEVIRRFK